MSLTGATRADFYLHVSVSRFWLQVCEDVRGGVLQERSYISEDQFQRHCVHLSHLLTRWAGLLYTHRFPTAAFQSRCSKLIWITNRNPQSTQSHEMKPHVDVWDVFSWCLSLREPGCVRIVQGESRGLLGTSGTIFPYWEIHRVLLTRKHTRLHHSTQMISLDFVHDLTFYVNITFIISLNAHSVKLCSRTFLVFL